MFELNQVPFGEQAVAISIAPLSLNTILFVPLVIAPLFGEAPLVFGQLLEAGFVAIYSPLNSIDVRTHASSIRSSQAISFPTTLLTKCSLSSVFKWELVYSTLQGPWLKRLTK